MIQGKTYDRVIGNWDEKDKMFYLLVQKWNDKDPDYQYYETVGTFQSIKVEVNK